MFQSACEDVFNVDNDYRDTVSLVSETFNKALIDTGSSVNLIGEKLVEKLGFSKLVTEGSFKLVGVTGAPLHTLGILHNVAVLE